MHTPGPWFAWRTEVEGRKAWVVTGVPEEEWTPQHRVIATLYGNDEISRSNAEIISKAPTNAKALMAAKRALTNPASGASKKSIASFTGILGDTLQDDLVRARRRSKLQEYTVAPMWRVFLGVCVVYTVCWTLYFAATFVHKYWSADL